MRHSFHAPSLPRPVRVCSFFAVLLCVSILFTGCGRTRHASDPELSARAGNRLRADDAAVFEACLAVCSENSSLALVTRNGCMAGCEETFRTFPLRGRTFSSRQACRDAVLRQEMRKDQLLQEMRQWCDAQWTHVHNRKGCRIAAEAFYANLHPDRMCGADAGTVAGYDTLPAQPEDFSGEDAAKGTPPAGPAAPAETATPAQPVERAAPTLQDPAPAIPQTEPESQPQKTDIQTGPAPAPASESATQPSGPLIPPPYAHEDTRRPSSEGSPASSGSGYTPGAQPDIRDTPKYQKTPAAATRDSKPAAAKEPAQPAPAGSPAAPVTQQPAAPDTSPESVPASVPPLPPDPTPTPVTQPVTQPVTPEQATPPPEPPAAPPAPPQPPTDQAGQTVPAEPVAPTAPADISGTTAPPEDSHQAGPPVTAQEQPDRQPDLPPGTSPGPGATAAEPPPPGPPVPGLNANRPVPESPEPPAHTPPALMPPVPSMLDRPYTVPPVIAPQIEVPE